MPAYVPVKNIGKKNIMNTLVSVMQERDRVGLLLALVVIYECLVVLATKILRKEDIRRGDLVKADSLDLKILDSSHMKICYNILKDARDNIAHNYYNKVFIKDLVLRIVETEAVSNLYVNLEIPYVEEAKEFERALDDVFGRKQKLDDDMKHNARKIIAAIPPSRREEFKGDEIDVALVYAAEMITKL